MLDIRKQTSNKNIFHYLPGYIYFDASSFLISFNLILYFYEEYCIN